MDYLEAIWRIKKHNEIHQRKEHFAVHITAALTMAIDACEKQVPKRPYWRKEEDAAGYACPICDMGVTADHGRIKDAYCSHCGQYLNWEGK
jgi:hypothetical protein